MVRISYQVNHNPPETSPFCSAEKVYSNLKRFTTSKGYTTLLSSHVSENAYVKVIDKQNRIVQ